MSQSINIEQHVKFFTAFSTLWFNAIKRSDVSGMPQDDEDALATIYEMAKEKFNLPHLKNYSQELPIVMEELECLNFITNTLGVGEPSLVDNSEALEDAAIERVKKALASNRRPITDAGEIYKRLEDNWGFDLEGKLPYCRLFTYHVDGLNIEEKFDGNYDVFVGMDVQTVDHIEDAEEVLAKYLVRNEGWGYEDSEYPCKG